MIDTDVIDSALRGEMFLWIVSGAFTGWILSTKLHRTMGALRGILLGILGAMIGGFVIMSTLGVTIVGGWLGFDLPSLIAAIFGASILTYSVAKVGERFSLWLQHRKVQKDEESRSKLGVVFISYRRSDSDHVAGRIYDRLVGDFGKSSVFKDVDSIPFGLDFKEYLDEKVGECNALLAIIGDRWLDARDATGKRRLDDPTDFVRIEIESALMRKIPVIPLLISGALLPSEEELPLSLRKLVYRNGIAIRPDPDFHRDMDRLISALKLNI